MKTSKLFFKTKIIQSKTVLSLTSGEEMNSPRRSRDEIDYPFPEIDETMANAADYMDIDRGSEHSSRHPSTGTSSEHNIGGDFDSDDSDYVQEATEDLDSSSHSSLHDEYDAMVTRGQANRRKKGTTNAKAKPTKAKMEKTKEKTRTSRTTRAASVRF